MFSLQNIYNHKNTSILFAIGSYFINCSIYYSYVSVIKTRMGYIDLQVEHCSYNNSRHLSSSGIVYYIEGSVFCLSHHRFKVFIQTYLSKK